MTRRKFLAATLAVALTFCLALGLILAFGLRFFARAETAESNDLTIATLSDKSRELNNGYLDRYGIPTSAFTYTNNGGAEDGAPLSYAFDRNFNSVWRSLTQTKADDKSTVNTVTVTFERAFSVDRIVYQADSSWYDRGYFNTLTLSYTDEKGAKVECEPIQSQQTSEIVLVTLKKGAVVKSMTLEWTKVPTNHRTVAAASEIIFLQPESNEVEAVQSMFTDYAQLHLDSGKIKSKEDVQTLREKVKDYATYDSELSYLLNRAEQVLDGAVSYDPRREMSTAECSNQITQHGDVAGYARSKLKFAWFGTNRQATGVSASPGDTLIVYVTGNEGDPLPSVVFSQHWGSWRAWRSGEYKLRLGKNVFEVPNYLQDGYTDNEGNPLIAGGPVYLVNPYTPDAQSQNVKVYFEGGDLFPIFRENGDEGAYKKFLADYADAVALDREENAPKDRKVVDVTEIVSDRTILTVRASRANDIYNARSFSPQTATETWDKYIDGLLQFDGIVLENDEEKLKDVGAEYDDRNRWLNVNIRLAQPYGAAYAHIEHIGIQVSWEATAIEATSTNAFGWGYTHEIGHMMDIGERTVSECSNNMISKFHETVIEGTAQRGDFAKTTEALAPDDHIASYWNTNRGNFIFWWLLESYYPGFWARLDNLYRYTDVYKNFTEEEKKQLGVMNATEKQVYLSSLVLKEDLSYYFERWGYNLSTNDYIFKANGENTSAAFKKLMKDAREKGLIKESTGLKFWYLDAAEWRMRYPEPAKCELYRGTEVPAIRSITKSGDGYNLIMEIEGAERDAHLGFEILEGSSGEWKVIGFTYDTMYLDAADYGNRTPQYKVVAYDRALKTSEESAAKSPATSADGVCEMNGVKYASLYEAVSAAGDGAVITLLKDTFETGILIEKNITIRADSACTITKGGPRPIFTVGKQSEDGSGTVGSLTLVGPAGKLTLDGGRISTNNPLLLLQGGTLNASDCLFTGNTVKQGTALGGALRIDGGKAELTRCAFENNAAGYGGGVYIANTRGNLETKAFDVNFTDCTFKNNTAAEGGGVYNRGSVTFRGCIFEENTASAGGGVANLNGGVIFFYDCAWTKNSAAKGGGLYADGRMDLVGGSIKNNTASEEGAALYILSSNSARALHVRPSEGSGETVQIAGNICDGGSAVYLAGNADEFTADVTDNRTLYAIWFGGTSKLKGGRIGGTIFKDAGAAVGILDALPEAAGGKIGVLTNSTETSLLLFSADFTLGEGEATRFETSRGNAVVKNGKEIWLEMESYTVTFVIGGDRQEFHYLPDFTFTLDARGGGLDQRTYVAAWTDDRNVLHAVGEEISVNRDMTFTAQVKDKFTVTFEVDAAAETESIVYYVMPAEPFTLPRIDPLKYVFSGWDLGGALYPAYDTAHAESDLVYTARLTKKLAAEYAIRKDGMNHVYATRYYAYGSKLTYVGCEDDSLMPAGGYIDGFYIEKDGALASEYVNFDTYTMQTDITLVAEVIDMPVYIVYRFLEGNHFWEGNDYGYELAPYGSTYIISLRSVPIGYHAVSVELNGVTYPQEALDGLQIELVDENGLYLLINTYIEKNSYNVTYQINGEFFKSETRKYGDEMILEDPTDTLLKDKFGEQQYSFNSYQIVTVDPYKDIEDLTRVQEMNIMIGDKVVVTEDITINLLVYVEGQEKMPETEPEDEDARALALQRLEKRALAQEMAKSLIDSVSASGFNLSPDEQSAIVTEINLALSSVLAELDGADSLAAMETAIETFGATLAEIQSEAELLAAKNTAKGNIDSAASLAQKTLEQVENGEAYLSEIERLAAEAKSELEAADAEEVSAIVERAKSAFNGVVEAAEREAGIVIEVRIGGITAKPKTYDGTTNVELDLTGLVFLNAATGFPIDADYSREFKLNVTAVLSDKNAGTRTATLTFTFEGGEHYALAKTGQQEQVTVEVKRAKLTVSLDEEGNPVYRGFVTGEDESVLSGELTVNYTEEDGVRMGTPGGLTSENYDIEFVSSPVAGERGADLGLILGISIPAAVLVLAAIVCVIFLRRLGTKKE